MSAWRLLPFALVLAVVPLFGSAYLTSVMIIIALHALPALGLSLVMGFAGQISLGHAAFYGLGAYGSALLALRLGISPWFATPVAVAASGLVAYGLGWLIFRLRGHHLALVTLGLGIVVSIGFVELRGLTGGSIGLSGIPPYALLGLDSARTDRSSFWPGVWPRWPSWRPATWSTRRLVWRSAASVTASAVRPRSASTWRG
ncbi:MAG: branched-chain amino acid ABC transporter permease [Pseudomonadota bacterium]